MSKGMKSTLTRRLLAAVLALVVGITFMPVLGAPVFADDGQGDGQQVEKSAAEDADATVNDAKTEVEVVVPEGDNGEPEEDVEEATLVEPEKSSEKNKETGSEKKAASSGDKAADAKDSIVAESSGTKKAALPKGLDKLTGQTNATSPKFYNFSGPNGSGYIHLTSNGQLGSGYQYAYVVMDTFNNYIRSIYSDKMDIWIDMRNYSVGYHSIGVAFRDKSTGQIVTTTVSGKTVPWLDIKTDIVNKIYTQPANGLGQYEAYHNRCFFKTGNSYSYDPGVKQYFEIRPVGAKNWKRYSVPDGNTSYIIPSLSPNRRYQARVFYGKSFSYDGVDRFWTSASTIRTFKTGVNVMPKSVKLKAYKVKKHKVKNRHYYIGWFRTYKYTTKWKYYTYKLKVVVKFKKKPGVKGIYVNGKWVNGNKKKYTVTVGGGSSLVKPKKLSYVVDVYTYQDRTYKGYSPRYYHKQRVH